MGLMKGIPEKKLSFRQILRLSDLRNSRVNLRTQNGGGGLQNILSDYDFLPVPTINTLLTYQYLLFCCW